MRCDPDAPIRSNRSGDRLGRGRVGRFRDGDHRSVFDFVVVAGGIWWLLYCCLVFYVFGSSTLLWKELFFSLDPPRYLRCLHLLHLLRPVTAAEAVPAATMYGPAPEELPFKGEER